MAGSPDPTEARARRRRIALVLLAVGLVALLVYLIGSTRSTDPAAADSRSPGRRPPAEADAPGPGDGRDQPGAPGADRAGVEAPPAPVIDAILVEKPEVCEGEENLITIKAHDARGNDAGLRYVVNGVSGSSVPLRARDNTEDPDAPPRSVTVTALSGAVTMQPIPAYKIKLCPAAAQLRMSRQLLANSTAEYRLEARVVRVVPPGRPKPARFAMDDFEPTRFTWDFGDGQTATTDRAYVEHSYEYRPQKTYFSYYLASVTAFDDQGRTMTARSSIEIMNPAYEGLAQKGVAKIMTHLTPRFPQLENGRIEPVVRLWHFQADEIVVNRILAYYHGRDGQDLGQTPVPPEAFLGARAIPPGAGLGIRVVLDVDRNPEIGFITYDLQGTTADGRRAQGSFSLMRPTEAPTPDKNLPVTDGMLAAKIIKAKEILGKDVVTDEDLWDLERQGKFKGLKPVAVKQPDDDGPPAWLPKPPRSDGEPWSPDDDPGPYEDPDEGASPAPR